MSNLKIIWLNTIVFFFGWNAIMLAGADFPPPIGFIWVVLLISMLDFIQYKYLQYFLPQLIKRKHNLFVKNLIFFVTGGMAVSILILATRYKITLEASIYDIIIWIAVFIIIGIIYGIVFWFFNRFLLRVFNK